MSSYNKYSLEIWIGLAKVKAQRKGSDVLQDSVNAYVTVLGVANNKKSFRKIVKSSLDKMGIELLRLEEIDTFFNRIKKFNVERNLYKKSNELLHSELRVVFSTFHTFD